MKEPRCNEFARKLLILLSGMLKLHMIKWDVLFYDLPALSDLKNLSSIIILSSGTRIRFYRF